MDKIKNLIIEKYREENLSLLFFYYHQMNPMEVMYFWNNILKILDESNVLQVLGFILDLQENFIIFPRYAQKSLNFHIHQVNKKIAKILPRPFVFYTKNLKLFKFAKENKIQEIQEKKFDDLFFLINSLYDTLIKTPTVEINNSIENYFNFGLLENLEIDLTKKLLNDLKKVDLEHRNVYIKYISSIVNSPKEILDHIFYNLSDEESAFIIECIYIKNKQIYNEILQVLYDNRKYYRVEIIKMLYELDIEKLDLKDENIEIIKYLIANKPVFVNDLLDVLNTKISKKHLLGIFIENFELLKNFKFEFNFDDLILISKEKPEILYEAYDKITDEKQKQTFFVLFKTLEEDFIVEFLKKHKDIELVSYILTNRKLENNLKKFIIENYKDNKQIIYKLFIYLDKSEVKKFLDTLLIDKKSLEYFLLVLKPTEILVYAHEMSDVSRGMKILDLCFESGGINENDFIFTLNIIENDMPPLIIRTLILTYKKYPQLKNFTVSYLFKLINKNALNNAKLKTGIIKLLEILDSSAVDIIAVLSKETIKNILDRSVVLRSICSKIIFRNEYRYKNEYNILRDIINHYPQ
ncbi:symplekin domain-containing protein [Vairimorpha necatrix]|uniref:Symplekin domain-containing protein n=1 Tax=Vairimorpha necatrix TaxID=6039 RepID=A0AAX4JA70_9MICR